MHLVPKPDDEVGGLLVLGSRGGEQSPQHRGRCLGIVGNGGGDESHSGVGAEGLGDGLQRGRVGAFGDLDREQQGPVESRAEASRQEVVGATGRRLLRVIALVGEGKTLVEVGVGESQQNHDTGDGGQPGPVLDDSAPPIGHRLVDRLGGAAGHFPTQGGEGEAGHHDHRSQRQSDDGERLESDGDSDQPHGQEQGGDQPTPAGHLDPLSGEAEHRREESE